MIIEIKIDTGDRLNTESLVKLSEVAKDTVTQVIEKVIKKENDNGENSKK